MNATSVSLLDLPDELLLAIFGKLNTVDALAALTTVHERIDALLHDRLFVRELDFTTKSWVDDRTLSAMCQSILPNIHHHVTSLTLDANSIERVLDDINFPQLTSLTLLNLSGQTLCQQLTGTDVLTTFIVISLSWCRKRDSHPSRHPSDHSSEGQQHRFVDEYRRPE